MNAATVHCPSCGAPTSINPEKSSHVCDYCGFPFIHIATQAAMGQSERERAKRTDAVRPQLDQLEERAQQAMRAGDQQEAERLLREHVAIRSRIDQETGTYAQMGVTTAAGIADYDNQLVAAMLREAAPHEQPPAPSSAAYQLYLSGMQEQNFDAFVEGYTALSREKMATQEEWQGRPDFEISLAIEQALRGVAANLSWATEEELNKVGIRFVEPVAVGDSHQVHCQNCQATLTIERLSESLVCEYCSATMRIQLTGSAVYHARGHVDSTEAQAARQQAANVAHEKKDIRAALTFAEGMFDAKVEPGSPKHRELSLYFAKSCYPWIENEFEAEAKSILSLGDDQECRTCSATIAPALDGTGHCPLCSEPLKQPAPKARVAKKPEKKTKSVWRRLFGS